MFDMRLFLFSFRRLSLNLNDLKEAVVVASECEYKESRVRCTYSRMTQPQFRQQQEVQGHIIATTVYLTRVESETSLAGLLFSLQTYSCSIPAVLAADGIYQI